MLIKMINGCYGLNDNGSIRPKTPSDPPFDVDKNEAKRLVHLGVAKILSKSSLIDADAAVSAEDAADNADTGEAETAASADDFEDDTGDDTEEADDTEDDIPDEIPNYGEESTNADLQAIAKEYGLEFPHKATKAQMLKILDNFFADGTPEVSAKEPE